MSLYDGNANLWGQDVAATSANTNPGCAIGPTSTEPLKEAGNVARPPTAFVATDGWQRWVARRGLLRNGRWNGKQYELRARPSFMYTQGR